MADKPSRLETPLAELMRRTRLEVDGVASGAITFGDEQVQALAKRCRVMDELIAEQDRQSVPTLTAADWLGRAELNIGDLRRQMARGQLDGIILQRAIDAAMTQLVAARAAAGQGRGR